MHLFTETELSFIADVLNRKEETDDKRRDEWGNWDNQFSTKNFRKPYLDEFVLKILNENRVNRISLWPDNKKFSFCLTHDLDVVSGNDPVQLFRRYKNLLDDARGSDKLRIAPYYFYTLLRSVFTRVKNDELWSFEKWKEAEGKYGFKSTWYVFAGTDPLHKFDCDYRFDDVMIYKGEQMKVGDFITLLHKEGSEVGLHGSFNTYNDLSLFNKEKKRIEELIGEPVLTARQHFLHWESGITSTIVKDAGILTDSTLGFNCATGFRAGTCLPYYLHDELLEIPMIIMDGSLFNNNSHRFNEEEAKQHIRNIIDQVADVGGCLVINFHPNYFNRPVWWNTYLYLLQELSDRAACCLSMKEIYNIVKRQCAA